MGKHRRESFALASTVLLVNGLRVPSSQAAFARRMVANCKSNISELACPVSHRVFSPENGSETTNITDNTEKGGKSHARMANIHLPSESMPGCLRARVMEKAVVRLVNGNDTRGLKTTCGTKSSPMMSKRSAAVNKSAQKIPVTMIA